jgi:hypothetical protein
MGHKSRLSLSPTNFPTTLMLLKDFDHLSMVEMLQVDNHKIKLEISSNNLNVCFGCQCQEDEIGTSYSM